MPRVSGWRAAISHNGESWRLGDRGIRESGAGPALAAGRHRRRPAGSRSSIGAVGRIIGALVVFASACLLLAAGRVEGSAAGSSVPPSTKFLREPVLHSGAASGGLAPLPVPSAAHPLTILEIGDSLGEDLGIGLKAVLGGRPHVVLKALAVGDTGLSNTAYYNWSAVLAKDLAAYHPAIVVVMLGGNDCQSFFSGPTLEEPGTSSFDKAYSARVGALMAEATAAKARVLWVGIPIIQPGALGEAGLRFSNCMVELNAAYAKEAASHQGATFFATWKLFEGPNGGYAEYLRIGGSLMEVRDPDGVHIDPPAGTDLIGNAVVKAMEADYHIPL